MIKKEKLVDMLELPKEILLNIPKLTLIGKKQMLIENYKSIVEYDAQLIKLKTTIGFIKIDGASLVINEITPEDLRVEGEIMRIDFL